MRIRSLFVLLVAGFLIAPVGLVLAEGDDDEAEKEGKERNGEAAGAMQAKKGAHFEKGGDGSLLVSNDHIKVWFLSTGSGRSKPLLQVGLTDDEGNRSGYKLQLDSLCEMREVAKVSDDDGAEGDDANETEPEPRTEFKRVKKACVNLHPAREWDFDTAGDNESLTITMSNDFAQGNVSLVFHIGKGDGKVKFDLLVADWQWTNNSNKLALKLRILERSVGDGEGERDRNVIFTSGFVTWAPSATASYPDGSNADLPVEARVRSHEDGAHILLVFNGTGGYSSLDYDPTLGISSSGTAAATGLPAPGVAALAAVVGVSALLFARRRR